MRAAHAKLNLYLHILGRRADGYHALETLVAFTTLADTLSISPSETLTLSVEGEFAAMCGPVKDNLVMKAAKLLQRTANISHGAALTLHKAIPAGAGLGGGSADAAAALQLLNDHWQLALNSRDLKRLARQLGADVVMCLDGVPLRARGIGEMTEPASLPPMHAVLVYPRKPLSTAQVYAMLELPPQPRRKADLQDKSEGQLTFDDTVFAKPQGFRGLLTELAKTRNDLQRPAVQLMPDIAEILLALETSAGLTRFVRMSGSGSCCFALLEHASDAETLAARLRASHPHWWVRATPLIS